MKSIILLILTFATISIANPFKNVIGSDEKEANQYFEGTICLDGCCPIAGFLCCAVGEYCAASEEDCKKTENAKKLFAMAAPKTIVKQDCEGPICAPDGMCCPNAGWVCCNSPTGLDICLPEEDLWDCD